jgi:hypothetical protein
MNAAAVAVDDAAPHPPATFEPVEDAAEGRPTDRGPLGHPAGPLRRRCHDGEYPELRQRHVAQRSLEDTGAGGKGAYGRDQVDITGSFGHHIISVPNERQKEINS